MKTDRTETSDVDDYIAGFPRPIQSVLNRVRGIIRKALPGAEEVISYRIPAYKVNGRIVLYFAGWSRHYSLYPFTGRAAAAFKEEIESYEISGKGTIRFPLSEPIPVKLIERIAKFRATEVAALEKAKAASKKR